VGISRCRTISIIPPFSSLKASLFKQEKVGGFSLCEAFDNCACVKQYAFFEDHVYNQAVYQHSSEGEEAEIAQI